MKKDNSKVTLLIPVYNGEKFIRESIESALNQTYNNLEIIVINDGSTDKTDAIVKEYENRIKYIKKENGGVSTVLNMAIKEMTGEYFSWLSHDDYYYPNKIEEEVKYMQTIGEKKAIVYSDFQIMDEFGKVIQNVELDHTIASKYYLWAFMKSSFNGITLLIPKKAFDESGLFDEKLRCTQDYAKWADMIKKGYKFYHLPKILTITRTHARQVTNTSPLMISEGNQLWKYVDNEIPSNLKKEFYRTNYNYYKMFANFLKDSPYKIAYDYMINNKNKYNTDPENIPISVIIIGDYDVKKYDDSLKSINEENTDVEIISIFKEDHLNFYSDDIDECIDYCKGKYISFLRVGDKFSVNNLHIQSNEMRKCKSIISMSSIKEFDNLEGHILSEIIELPHFESSIMLEKKFIIQNNIKFNNDFRFAVINCLKEMELLLVIESEVKIEQLTYYSQEENINLLKNIMADVELSNNTKLILKICSIILRSSISYIADVNQPTSIIKKTYLIFKEYGLVEVVKRIHKRIRK